ncbi:hypothetical protein ILUMI_13891 [Ignelater luminosus]|uniref:Uncharacterized protein n=1 Tax=Ignelater luminosus TaxID=2038154 RepID=A0A8K0CZU3_IGNLU|nr:hypothetical protein ILUMI_13891 [Ignelater luminosus]
MPLTRDQISKINTCVTQVLTNNLSDGKFIDSIVKKIIKNVADIKKELQNSIILLEKENKDWRERSDALKQYSRRNNIRIFGVSEEAGEKVESRRLNGQAAR